MQAEAIDEQTDARRLAPIADAASAIQYAGFGSTQIVAPVDLNTVLLDSWSISTPSGEIAGSIANGPQHQNPLNPDPFARSGAVGLDRSGELFLGDNQPTALVLEWIVEWRHPVGDPSFSISPSH